MPAILIVCTANQIRSVLAEYLLRRCLTDDPHTAAWSIESAGTWTRTGMPARTVTRHAGAEMGMDLNHHRSQRVEDLDLVQYDLVLTMERGQRDALRAEHPEAVERIMTITQALTGYEYDIVDPPGHTQAAVRRTARELADLIERGTPRLVCIVNDSFSANRVETKLVENLPPAH